VVQFVVQNRARVGLDAHAVELVAGVVHESVEGRAVVALGALLELRVDVHRHLRVGVAYLIHHPLHVKVVRQQGDADVGAPQAVWRDVRQGWQAPLAHSFGGESRGCVEDLPDALAHHAPAAFVLEEVRLGAGVVSSAA